MNAIRTLCLAALSLCLASPVLAAPIISGDGEAWTSTFSTVCTQLGSNTPCGGSTVVIDAHPAWQDASLTIPEAQWVSYADTGYQGAVLAPRAGSATNPTGQVPIMEIVETFTGSAGAPLFVRFWADDTLAVFLNGVQMKAPEFGQDTCANVPIGCQPNEYWDLIATTTGNLDTLRLVAYQVGTGTTTTANPFGVLYSGAYAEGEGQTVPEPMTLTLFGAGLAALGVRRARARRR